MAKISLSKISSEELDRMLCSDTTDAVSMDTTTTPASVSKDTPPTESPVSMDTQMAENAVSKDTIPGNDAVSKDTDRSAYQREFRKKRYKTVSMDMRPEEVMHFREWATAHNMSLTEFFRRAGNAYIVSLGTDKP